MNTKPMNEAEIQIAEALAFTLMSGGSSTMREIGILMRKLCDEIRTRGVAPPSVVETETLRAQLGAEMKARGEATLSSFERGRVIDALRLELTVANTKSRHAETEVADAHATLDALKVTRGEGQNTMTIAGRLNVLVAAVLTKLRELHADAGKYENHPDGSQTLVEPVFPTLEGSSP